MGGGSEKIDIIETNNLGGVRIFSQFSIEKQNFYSSFQYFLV